MKVLHLALVTGDNDGAIDLGFSEHGHVVRRVNWTQLKEASSREAASHAGWADLVFYQGQGSSHISTDVLDLLRQTGAFVVNWTGDVRDDVKWYAKMAPHVDLTLFTNRTDIDLMRTLGFKADYLQVGYDHRLFNVDGPEQERSGIVFMGNNYWMNGKFRFPQGAFRLEMVERMRLEFGDQFKAYGSNYPKEWGYRPCNYIEEAAIYNRSLLAIGADHYLRPSFASDRLLRSQACGVAVLQHEYPRYAEEANKGPIFWSDLDDLVMMTRDLLDHPEEAVKMGAWNAKDVYETCRWGKRIERLEELIETYR